MGDDGVMLCFVIVYWDLEYFGMLDKWRRIVSIPIYGN